MPVPRSLSRPKSTRFAFGPGTEFSNTTVLIPFWVLSVSSFVCGMHRYRVAAGDCGLSAVSGSSILTYAPEPSHPGSELDRAGDLQQ
eukprot:3405751-Pleurochrysis_carterae.AAC.1